MSEEGPFSENRMQCAKTTGRPEVTYMEREDGCEKVFSGMRENSPLVEPNIMGGWVDVIEIWYHIAQRHEVHAVI